MEQTETIKEPLNDKKNLKSKKNSENFFNFLWYYYKKFYLSAIFLVAVTIVTCGITVALPKITNIMMNDFMADMASNSTPYMDWTIFIYWVIGFCSMFLVQGIFTFFQWLIGGKLARKIEIDIRLKVLNKLLDLDMAYYYNKQMGDILTKLISDTQIIGEQSFQVPITFLRSFLTFFGSVVIMYTLTSNTAIFPDSQSTQVMLSTIILGIALAVLFLSLFLFAILRKKIMKQREDVTKANAAVNDRVNAIKLIKTTGTKSEEKEKFIDSHKEYYKSSVAAVKFQSWFMALILTVFTSLNSISLLFAIMYANEGKLDPTIMISLSMSINALVMPIVQAVRVFSNLATASTSAERINDIVDTDFTIHWNETAKELDNLDVDIIFKDVDFKYIETDPLILEKFNFTFKKGKSYAIVGETGAGKSTISQLLLRTYDPVGGKILIGKNELNKINLKSYLHKVGYVEQEPQILFGDFYINIAYGRPNATKTQIIDACKKANLYDFVMGLPNKFDTVLGERGFILSGGQKQRIIIARMFLKNPELLILDEATSALDNIVEKEIQGNLNELMTGRTSIVIAHRLSTIKNVDEILVIGKNKGLIQTGTFEELRKKEGHFKKLYEAGLMT
ncbi:ABC transporter ATP-binding protein [Spiroplasma endosymbiont of Amphibalanus improvisus]|uniref:ABC transporter ATP-binding protein n=1 Tax=Spiroplasma endosymbiont of Amphibalanus improvisus TaxID=3066327 RepID=UPI00313BBEF5